LGDKIKKLKDFGRTGGGLDIHNEFGINCKFTELQAIVGLSQISNINDRIVLKKAIYKFYKDRLKNIPNISFIDTDLSYVTPWFADIYIKDRENLQKYLYNNGIQTRQIYSSIY
jgi:perosamine synthetase